MRPPNDFPPANEAQSSQRRPASATAPARRLAPSPESPAAAAFFHIRKLIAQRRNAALAKTSGNRRHEGMGHSGACAMGKPQNKRALSAGG